MKFFGLIYKSAFLFIGLVVVIVITYYNLTGTEKMSLTNPELDTHIVILTDTGFSPKTLVIRLGDKVIFNTDRNLPYWPASSMHPDHLIYPEFDSMTRIMPPENWEFTFDKSGVWNYHDHISPNYNGSITVLEVGEESAAQENLMEKSCETLAGYQKSQCWDQKLRYVLKSEGMEAAFAFFVELYATEPDVPKACHEWGHALGEAGYELYKDGQPLELRAEASYCGYGYFHSFIAEMIKDTGDMAEILSFCKVVENELQDELPNIHNNCVHGVGHGTTAWLLEQPENWGDFMRTASAGTKVCETLYTEPNDLENCYDGVFNELHLDVLNYEYGMDFGAFMEKDDPFYYCQLQEERHKEACYFEFIGIFWKIFDNDLLAATDYIIENVHDLQKRGPRTVSKIAADWIQNDIVKDSWEVNIQACRNVPSYLQKKCIQGIANGFIQHGEPNNLHLKGFAFCAADYLTEEERGICYSSFIGMLRWVYEEDLYLTACGILPEEVSIQYCTKHSVR